MYGRLSHFVEAIPEDLLEFRQTPVLRASSSSTPHRSREGREAFQGGGSYVELDEPSLNQDAPRYVKGERVAHATFGSGTVLEISGFGKDTKVTVEFDTVGRKRLLIRYANLEKDWDL
ncbi:MAG TPA: hypothetical protein VLA43_15290 [Longimicrobiales bacterium]|nr:hypothetical protein [Longimicrobiales bacterium]